MSVPNPPTAQRDRALAAIARRVLDVPTLETRRSDRLDFHDVAVWSIAEALRLAWSGGYEQAVEDREGTVAPAVACPACGEDHTDRLVWTEEETVRCASCGAEYEPPRRPAEVDAASMAIDACQALSDYAHNFYEDLPADLAAIVDAARGALSVARKE